MDNEYRVFYAHFIEHFFPICAHAYKKIVQIFLKSFVSSIKFELSF